MFLGYVSLKKLTNSWTAIFTDPSVIFLHHVFIVYFYGTPSFVIFYCIYFCACLILNIFPFEGENTIFRVFAIALFGGLTFLSWNW